MRLIIHSTINEYIQNHFPSSQHKANLTDKLAEERGFLSRFDAVRAVLSEHMSIFSKRVNRNPALTPFDAEANGNDCCMLLENDISLSKPQSHIKLNLKGGEKR